MWGFGVLGQDVLFEIDEAIRRLENGSYGICEMSGDPINIERLQALPYVRYSITAQSEIEKGRTTYRPFGSTIRGYSERAGPFRKSEVRMSKS